MIADRFIPFRQYETEPYFCAEQDENSQSQYNILIEQILNKPRNVLTFSQNQKADFGFPFNTGLTQSITQLQILNTPHRMICSTPEKILDAPDLKDDFYINPLTVALNNSVYLWHHLTGDITHLLSLSSEDDPNSYFSSVQFCSLQPDILFLGCSDSRVKVFDITKQREIYQFSPHSARVTCLASNPINPNHLISASKDTTIVHSDLRMPTASFEVLTMHNQEVCGLKWKNDARVVASGGNDNKAILWENQGRRLRTELRGHQAAVKAICWMEGVEGGIITGGGTADMTMKMWNSDTGQLLQTIDTESQVCSLVWSSLEKEVVSSHGFSKNQLAIWKYSNQAHTFQKVKELQGHQSRVLHLSLCPQGDIVVSAAADETLRFWRVFGTSTLTYPKNQKTNLLCESTLNIR